MLVLARKVGSSIIINDNIEILVIEVRGDQVRLGIMAPGNIPIYRKELPEEAKAHIRAEAHSKVSAECDQTNLVLARKVGHSIEIEGGIEVLVIEVRGDQVRLGIGAPKDIPVDRKELYERIEAENALVAAEEAAERKSA